jgi:hypothetical protein
VIQNNVACRSQVKSISFTGDQASIFFVVGTAKVNQLYSGTLNHLVEYSKHILEIEVTNFEPHL